MSAKKRKRLSLPATEENNRLLTRTDVIPLTLVTLPPEVLAIIFKFLPSRVVASSVRLVSRHCMAIATSVLNATFFSFGQRLNYALANIDSKISTATNASEMLLLSKTYDVLEVLRTQWRMLRAVTWRYTHPPQPNRFSRLCFYAGGLLDDLNRLLYLVRFGPAALLSLHAPDANVTDFCNHSKRFMNYFEKVSEKKLNRSPLVSGCKAVDILDCLVNGRKVLAYRFTQGRSNQDGIVCMQLRYVLPRAWFTCLNVPCAVDENSWNDSQRFMYLRLRRLVGSVNEHDLERVHYQRKLKLQKKTFESPRRPLPSTYSGYGEYGGRFFYYGNMNKYAFSSKNRLVIYEHDDEEGTDNISPTTNCDLIITIELRCSIELAPLAMRPHLNSDHVDNKPLYQNPELYIKMNINCPASTTNRIPSHFTWEQRVPSRRTKHRLIH